MLFDKVFVSEFLTVNRFSTSSVLSGEVAALTHKAWNDSMEWTTFVPHALFSGAQSSEVLNGFWDNVVVHVENDSTSGLSTNGHVEVALDRHGIK